MAFESSPADPGPPLDEQQQYAFAAMVHEFNGGDAQYNIDPRIGHIVRRVGEGAVDEEILALIYSSEDDGDDTTAAVDDVSPGTSDEAETADLDVFDGTEEDPEPPQRARTAMGVIGLAVVVGAASVVGILDNRGGTTSEQPKYLEKDRAVVTAVDDFATLRQLAVCRPEIEAQTEYMDYQGSLGASGTGAPEVRAALARALSSPDTATIPCVASNAAQSQFMLPVSSAGATSAIMESDIVGPFSVGDWCVTDKAHLDATAVRIGNAMMATAAPSACTDISLPVPVNSLPGVVPAPGHS
jgi:hypothetical protein